MMREVKNIQLEREFLVTPCRENLSALRQLVSVREIRSLLAGHQTGNRLASGSAGSRSHADTVPGEGNKNKEATVVTSAMRG